MLMLWQDMTNNNGMGQDAWLNLPIQLGRIHKLLQKFALFAAPSDQLS
jgi:hypothetical protein